MELRHADTASKTALYNMIATANDSATIADGTVKRALAAIRSHLGMEVAYVSEFVDDWSIFREVDAPGLEAMIQVGDSHSLDDVYCRHILAGRLPQLMPDNSAEPLAMSMRSRMRFRSAPISACRSSFRTAAPMGCSAVSALRPTLRLTSATCR